MKKTCSQTIKACDLKSTKQVAGFNGVTPRTVQMAFKHDYLKFVRYVLKSLDSESAERRLAAEAVLTKERK